MFSSSLALSIALLPLLALAAPIGIRDAALPTETRVVTIEATVTSTITVLSTQTPGSVAPLAIVEPIPATTSPPPTLVLPASVPTATGASAADIDGSGIVFAPPPAPTALSAPAHPKGSGANATTSSVSTSKDAKGLVMAYYPDWAGDAFPPEKIDFDRFDWIDFAFALPTETFDLTWDNPDGAPQLLKRLVAAAHAKGKLVKLSVGGWTGSKYFSPAVETANSRVRFATNIASLYAEFCLDGIDIDWEYPSQPGSAGNEVNAGHDTANYLLFLQLLRKVLPKEAKITAAALTEPWAGPDGAPLADMAAFADALDWVLLMNYDVWGSSPTPGPNAPLRDGCGNSTQPTANAANAIAAWMAAGFPADKITLGLPSYGYVSRSTAILLHERQVPGVAQAASLTVTNEDGGIGDGQVQFRELVNQGALVHPSAASDDTAGETRGPQPTYIGGGGYTRYWDECSSTPYLRSAGAGQVITYDDPESLGMKARLAAEQGLKGVNMFDVHGDTDSWDLIDAVRTALAK